jgi:hypothetical protein
MSTTMLMAGYIMAFLGILFRWAVTVTKGVAKTDNNTPTKFSWHHFNLKAKFASVISTVIALFVYFRFGGEYFNEVFSMGAAFVAGISIDIVISKISLLKLKK